MITYVDVEKYFVKDATLLANHLLKASGVIAVECIS